MFHRTEYSRLAACLTTILAFVGCSDPQKDECASDDDCLNGYHCSADGDCVADGGDTDTDSDTDTDTDTDADTDADTDSDTDTDTGTGVEVTVLDSATGNPIEGATVDADGVEAATSDQGMATFDVKSVAAVSIFAQGYQYFTATGLTGRSMRVHLKKLPDPAKATGVQGLFDLSQTENGEVKVAIAGMSSTADLTNLDVETQLGDSAVMAHLTFGEMFNDDAPLPPGMHLALGTTTFKDGYMLEGEEGARAQWALGGQISLAELIGPLNTVKNRCSNDGCEFGAIAEFIAAVVPFVGDLEHTVMNTDVPAAIAMVPDVDDIDGDGDTTELIPDYDSFPDSGPLTPDAPCSSELELNVPQLPMAGGEQAEAAYIVVGAMTPKGLVNLGFGLGVDKRDETDAADGYVGDDTDGKVMTSFAPRHSGLETSPLLVATLASWRKIDGDRKSSISGRLELVDTLPGDSKLDVPAFLGFVENASFTSASREFVGDQVAVADLYRMTLIDEDVEWQVYLPSGNPDFTLPEVPDGFTDVAADPIVKVEAWETRDDLDLDGLLAPDDTSLQQINELVAGFSTVVLGEPAGGGCDYNVTCSANGRVQGGVHAWALMLLAWLAIRRRGRR